MHYRCSLITTIDFCVVTCSSTKALSVVCVVCVACDTVCVGLSGSGLSGGVCTVGLCGSGTFSRPCGGRGFVGAHGRGGGGGLIGVVLENSFNRGYVGSEGTSGDAIAVYRLVAHRGHTSSSAPISICCRARSSFVEL